MLLQVGICYVQQVQPLNIPDYPDAFAGWDMLCSTTGSTISLISTGYFS
jgi:hypothetical protein